MTHRPWGLEYLARPYASSAVGRKLETERLPLSPEPSNSCAWPQDIRCSSTPRTSFKGRLRRRCDGGPLRFSSLDCRAKPTANNRKEATLDLRSDGPSLQGRRPCCRDLRARFHPAFL